MRKPWREAEAMRERGIDGMRSALAAVAVATAFALGFRTSSASQPWPFPYFPTLSSPFPAFSADLTLMKFAAGTCLIAHWLACSFCLVKVTTVPLRPALPRDGGRNRPQMHYSGGLYLRARMTAER